MMNQSLEILINGEGRDLDLHNSHTRVTCHCAIPSNLTLAGLSPPFLLISFFGHWLMMVFKVTA